MLWAAAAGLLVFPAAASAAPPPVGGLTQLTGVAGCFANTATPGSCQAANGIFRPESATVSPDGKFVYVGSYPVDFNGALGLAAFSRNPQTGQLTQLPGAAGCYTSDGSSQAGAGTCTAVQGLGVGDGRDFTITSDGRWAYMVNTGTNGPLDPHASIVIFQRDPVTGALSQPAAPNGCISQDGSSLAGPNTCQTMALLNQPNGITISPDDRFVYVSDFGNNSAVYVFARDATTGGLSQVQCLSDVSTPPAGCTAGRELGDVQALVISPDGRHAYAAHFTNGISILDRDPQTGMLTQKAGTAGCVNNDAQRGCATGRALNGTYAIVISPDGHTLYATAGNDNGVAIFHVNSDGSLTQLAGAAGCITLTGADGTGNTTCTTGRAIEQPFGDAISPDGHTLYVTEIPNAHAEGGVAVFSIDPVTGALSQLPGATGCITADGASGGTAGACAVGGPALAGAYTPSLSPDGTSLYVASYWGASVTTFAVESGPICRATTASTAYQTPVSVSLSCADRDGDPVTTSITAAPAHGTLGPAGSTVTYTPAAGFSGTDTFTFDASDGTNVSAPVTATITVGSPAQATPPAKAPVSVTHVNQSRRTWRESRHGGTTFTFTLSQAARVTFTFTLRNHTRPIGRLTIRGHAGRNKLAFNGRINARTKLKPGTYTVTITAGASKPRRLTFTIVK